MPVDKFGRMSDTKTTDSGVSLTYINNNYVRSDGGTPLTGSLDMKGNIIYNVAEPVNPQDVATKVYVDNTKGSGVIGRRIGDAVSIKENMDFMGKQKIKNLPDPVNDHDAATKEYVDTKTELGNIDMGGKFTILNVKTPINDNHITDKKYVDDNAAFVFRNNEYYAKGNIFLRDGEASTKKYVDDSLANHFIDGNDNIVFGRDVDMEGNKIFALPEPDQDSDPATKKYVDDLQNRYIDKRGNLKFGRNINLDNKRIFALKDPKKDYEATNKKYVDDSITKRLQEEKDKFLPKDPATKEYVDEAIKGLAGGNILVSKEGVFIKANGHYRATAPLDIDNHKMENLPEPLEDGDAANKKYVDGIVEDLTLKQGLIRENGGFNLVDSYINMNFNNIRNVGLPNHEADAVPRSFVDDMIKEVEEKINKRKQLIAVNTRYCGLLKKGEYHFNFNGANFEKCKEAIEEYKDFKGLITGFIIPHSGYIKKIICEIVTFTSIESYTNFIFNFLSDYKKEAVITDFLFLEKAGYVSIEDVLKKGIDDFKKTIEKENIFGGETETKLLDDLDPFQIVKFEKSLNPKDYLTKETPLKILTSVLLESLYLKNLFFSQKMVGAGAFSRSFKNYNIVISEGDTINIKSKIDNEKIKPPISKNNIKEIFKAELFNFISSNTNFNFTFLIELDPL